MFIPIAQLEPVTRAVAGRNAAWEPRNPHLHLLNVDGDPHLMLVNGSRLYGLDRELASRLRRLVDGPDPDRVLAELASLGLEAKPYIEDTPLERPPIRSLSLAVAQKCNLGCTYCYAQEGDFGSAEKNMPLQTALDSVDTLLSEAQPGERFNLAFLGGEPLTSRDVVRATTEYAAAIAFEKRAILTFSLTTNGTLVCDTDAGFFERYAFAVTVSIDGIGETHDRLRPFKGGVGSYDRILARVKPLLARQRKMQVSARATVTPKNLHIRKTLDELIALGFDSVGFSPMLSSPTGRDEMEPHHLETMLEQMVQCGREFERQVTAGHRYPFLNMSTAMREIHRGTHRPYPCGAGAGYLGVSADGEFSACHRFVNDSAGEMGTLATGIDLARQQRWLSERHVHRQEPCRVCWARYLCGGGCHHEVINRGRPACDYIRGWLHYCLQAYVRLLEARPDYFAP